MRYKCILVILWPASFALADIGYGVDEFMRFSETSFSQWKVSVKIEDKRINPQSDLRYTMNDSDVDYDYFWEYFLDVKRVIEAHNPVNFTYSTDGSQAVVTITDNLPDRFSVLAMNEHILCVLAWEAKAETEKDNSGFKYLEVYCLPHANMLEVEIEMTVNVRGETKNSRRVCPHFGSGKVSLGILGDNSAEIVTGRINYKVAKEFKPYRLQVRKSETEYPILGHRTLSNLTIQNKVTDLMQETGGSEIMGVKSDFREHKPYVLMSFNVPLSSGASIWKRGDFVLCSGPVAIDFSHILKSTVIDQANQISVFAMFQGEQKKSYELQMQIADTVEIFHLNMASK